MEPVYKHQPVIPSNYQLSHDFPMNTTRMWLKQCHKPSPMSPLCLPFPVLGGLLLFEQLYHLVMTNIAMENPLWVEGSMGKSSLNGPFSMAMLNNQRVYVLD